MKNLHAALALAAAFAAQAQVPFTYVTTGVSGTAIHMSMPFTIQSGGFYNAGVDGSENWDYARGCPDHFAWTTITSISITDQPNGQGNAFGTWNQQREAVNGCTPQAAVYYYVPTGPGHYGSWPLDRGVYYLNINGTVGGNDPDLSGRFEYYVNGPF